MRSGARTAHAAAVKLRCISLCASAGDSPSGWSLVRSSLCTCLSLAAVCVAAEDDDDMDIDRTHFEDPALMEDPVATAPHSEIEVAWVLPDSPDGSKPQPMSHNAIRVCARTRVPGWPLAL